MLLVIIWRLLCLPMMHCRSFDLFFGYKIRRKSWLNINLNSKSLMNFNGCHGCKRCTRMRYSSSWYFQEMNWILMKLVVKLASKYFLLQLQFFLNIMNIVCIRIFLLYLYQNIACNACKTTVCIIINLHTIIIIIFPYPSPNGLKHK